jgi:hypothetical protein
MSTSQNPVGRPRAFTGALLLAVIAALKASDTGNGANYKLVAKTLTARPDKRRANSLALAAQRKELFGLDQPVTVCPQTLKNVCKENGIKFLVEKVGRKPSKATVKLTTPAAPAQAA